MKKIELLTIGYEGLGIDDFIGRLKQFNISRLIDIREIPISRKKGFSKTVLQDRLKDENIEYVHIKALGSPSTLRKKLKSDWDYDYFFNAYSDYLSQNNEIVEQVYEYLLGGTNCIMCFEQTPEKCHRSIVAEKIKEYDGNGMTIKHI
jgi:uncharacterized protein (DUF488 family)